jgi:hypothetical protein
MKLSQNYGFLFEWERSRRVSKTTSITRYSPEKVSHGKGIFSQHGAGGRGWVMGTIIFSFVLFTK